MNIRQAQYLIAVYEEGSISGAAKRLYITQPALSQTAPEFSAGEPPPSP